MSRTARIICLLSPLLSVLIWFLLVIELTDAPLPYRAGFWIGSIGVGLYCIALTWAFAHCFRYAAWRWQNITAGVIASLFSCLLIVMSIWILRDLDRGWTDALLP